MRTIRLRRKSAGDGACCPEAATSNSHGEVGPGFFPPALPKLCQAHTSAGELVQLRVTQLIWTPATRVAFIQG